MTLCCSDTRSSIIPIYTEEKNWLERDSSVSNNSKYDIFKVLLVYKTYHRFGSVIPTSDTVVRFTIFKRPCSKRSDFNKPKLGKRVSLPLEDSGGKIASGNSRQLKTLVLRSKSWRMRPCQRPTVPGLLIPITTFTFKGLWQGIQLPFRVTWIKLLRTHHWRSNYADIWASRSLIDF